MSIPCDKTFLLVPSSRSSVKVKYQGHSFQQKKKKKMAVAGAWVFRKHILFLLSYNVTRKKKQFVHAVGKKGHNAT